MTALFDFAGDETGPASLNRAVVRIVTGAGTTIGVGFLVDAQRALTCAHVVSTALGLAENVRPAPTDRVSVDLPLAESHHESRTVLARVEQWIAPHPSGAGDVAVLRLEATLPGALPVRLVNAPDVWGHPARAFGFPAGRPGGVWHHGVLRARQANGWVQADLAASGYRVSAGFSGGPVWDDELSGVIGMMAVAEAGETPVSYLIPTSGLQLAWPQLRDLASPPSPFRGLRPFVAAESSIFHGRNFESDRVADAVETEPWTTIVGPSGTGKSSLAMAGVIPRRRAAGDCAVVLRPGHHASPVHALAAALLPLLEPDLSETDQLIKNAPFAETLTRQGLHDVVPRVLRLHQSDRLLIVIDQFEELLDRTSGDIETFANIVFDGDLFPAVRVLATLRADFLEPALTHPRLGPVVSRHLYALEPMRRDQLREIIERPISEIPGVQYETHLVERILADTGTDSGALPLVSFTLDLLWRGIQNGVLTHQAYDRLGGVAGALGDYAQRAWAENVSEQDEPVGQRLLTKLIRVPIGATAATRRVAARTELDDDEWRIAQRLAATRLLVIKNSNGGHASVELTHETLIAGWDRLTRQVAADRAFLDWRESLRHEQDRWIRAERIPELLPASFELDVARKWMESRSTDLSAAEREFLEVGRTHHRSRTRRRRALQSGLAALVAVTLVFISLFLYAQRQSKAIETLADSRALAQMSQDEAAFDPAMSTMMALSAYQIAPTREARNQLLREYLAYTNTARALSGLTGQVATFQHSRDGQVVFAASKLGRTTLFVHALSGAVRSKNFSVGYVLFTAVSGDGRRAAFVTESGEAGWFEVHPDDAEIVGTVHRLPKINSLGSGLDVRNAAAMSADGKLLVTHTTNRLVWWDLERGILAGSAPMPPDATVDLWISGDNRTILVKTERYTGSTSGLTAVDMASARARAVLPVPGTHATLVSGDRSTVVACRPTSDGKAVLEAHNVSDGSSAGKSFRMPYCAGLEAADQRGRRVVVSDGLHSHAVIDLDEGRKVTSLDYAPCESLSCLSTDLVSSGDALYLVRQGIAEIRYIPVPRSVESFDVVGQRLVSGGAATLSLLRDGSLMLRPTWNDANRVLARSQPPQPAWDPQGNSLSVDDEQGLVANREDANVVSVRDIPNLRERVRISTPAPSDPSTKGELEYFFNASGHLVTVSGTKVQMWDPQTGQQLARFDASVLNSKLSDNNPPHIIVDRYPSKDKITVVVWGDPSIYIVDLLSGKVVDSVKTTDDAISVAFDASSRYFVLLRRSGIVELWRRNPLRMEQRLPYNLGGDERGTHTRFVSQFLSKDGQFLVGSNNAIRIYQIGKPGYIDSYEFGHPDGSKLQSPYSFEAITEDGKAVILVDSNGIGRPLKLDPSTWMDELCRVIGYREFTAEERRPLPGLTTSTSICQTYKP